MQSILLRSDAAGQDSIITELWQHGTLGVIEEPTGLRAFFDNSRDLGDVLAFFAARTLETRTESPPDPANFPKQDWDPIIVGERFWIAPSWVDQPVPPDRIRLAIDNPNAFGTGRHESTQLALEALEQNLRSTDIVVDIGSGSGILSQAALRLGAGQVFSCDIHVDAINSTKAQLQPRLFLGSADAVRTQTADLVLANISAKVIDALSRELNRITKPNGLLVLTGFIRDHPPERFSPEKVTERGDWLCWFCRPQPGAERDARVAQTHPLEWW